MRTIDEIIEQAKRLTPRERRLIDELEELESLRAEVPKPAWVAAMNAFFERLIDELEELKSLPAEVAEEPEPAWLVAMDAFLALGGTAHSDYTDVSSDKHEHLAEIYADKHE